VAAVIAESYERIHRSNLIGMGVVPLEFLAGENAAALGLTGEEIFETVGLPALIAGDLRGARQIAVNYQKPDGSKGTFQAKVRIDTPQEASYYQHGGILPFVLRQMLARPAA
jgi:aconitate hydratase